MLNIFKNKFFRNIFTLSLVLFLTFPIVDIFVIAPSFTNTIITHKEKESEKIATHLAIDFGIFDNWIIKFEDLERFKKEIDGFGIKRYKVLTPDWKIVFSSNDDEIGKTYYQSIFEELVKNKKSYTNINHHHDIQTNHELISDMDDVEIYVPYFINDKFVGMFEFYIDITALEHQLFHDIYKFYIPLLFLAFLLFVIITILLKRATDLFEKKEKADKLLTDVNTSLVNAQAIAQMGNWDWDIKKNIVHWSDEIYKIFCIENKNNEFSCEQFISFIHPDDKSAVEQAVKDSLADPQKEYNIEHRIICSENIIKIVRETGKVTFDTAGSAVFMSGVVQDITKYKHLEQKLDESKEQELKHFRYQDVLANITEIGLQPSTLHDKLLQCLTTLFEIPWLNIESKGSVFVWDNKQNVLVNTAQIGLSPEIQERCATVKRGYCLCGKVAATKEAIFRTKLDNDHDVTYDGIKEHGHFCIPIQAYDEFLGVLNLYIDEQHVYNEDESRFLKRVANTIATMIQQDQKSKLLDLHAYVDPLTDLYNRRGFNRHLANLLQKYNSNNGFIALMCIDLDHFKYINDKYGQHVGDNLLIYVTKRLTEYVRAGDLISRLGGDEFALSFFVATEDLAGMLANRIIQSLNEPITISNESMQIGASIGITLYPKDSTNQEELFKCAETALYAAKEFGRNQYSYFDKEIQQKALDKQTLTEKLKHAIANNELTLYYQPQVSLKTGRLVGAEALIRWFDSDKRFISPADFIPIAEESGLIIPIGLWVFEEVCKKFVEWTNSGLPPITLGVNLSPRQIREANFPEKIMEIVERTGMNIHYLELEITESSTEGRGEDKITKNLNQLADLGFRLAIDDYGTGASSLKRLHLFPVSTLKIDKSFIDGLPDDKGSRTIVSATIALGKGLNMKIIAEGIETEAQRRFLIEAHCDEMQGYLYERPLPADKFVRILLEDITLRQLEQQKVTNFEIGQTPSINKENLKLLAI